MIYFALVPSIILFFMFQLYRKPHFYLILAFVTIWFSLGALAATLISPGLIGVEVQWGPILVFGSAWGFSTYLFFKLLMRFEEGQEWLKNIAGDD